MGTETRYLYDGMLVVQERNASNTPQVSYTRGQDLGGGFQSAGGIGGLLARKQHTGTGAGDGYYHSDGNGNVTAILAPDGNSLLAAYLFDPYGRTLESSGTWASANVYRFSSKEHHAASGLYYYGFRFYSPDLQRWINRDPIGEAGGINLYGFVGNGPINNYDLDGRWSLGLVLDINIDFIVHLGAHLGVHIAKDPCTGKWSFGVLAGPEGGAGALSTGITGNIMVTEAPSVHCLKGLGAFGGVSGGEGITGQAQAVAAINGADTVYWGGMVGAGLGVGTPVAGSAGFSYDVGWDSEGGWNQ